MSTQTYSSFEAYFDANRHSRVRGMILECEHEDWSMTHLKVNDLSVQWGKTGAKLVVEGATQPLGTTVFFSAQNSSVGNGRRIDESSLMIGGPDTEFCIANDGPNRWCSLYIPNEMLTGANGDATTPAASIHGVIQLPPHRVERFHLALEQLGVAFQRAPGDFESAPSQKSVEQKLVREMRNLSAMA